MSNIFEERQPDMLGRVHPAPSDQHKVALVGALAMLPEHIVQSRQSKSLLAHQQNTRSFPVETMSQFQELGLRPLAPQRLDHAKADAAAAMHRHALRLIDG